jgi:hypothetical protein
MALEPDLAGRGIIWDVSGLVPPLRHAYRMVMVYIALKILRANSNLFVRLAQYAQSF